MRVTQNLNIKFGGRVTTVKILRVIGCLPVASRPVTDRKKTNAFCSHLGLRDTDGDRLSAVVRGFFFQFRFRFTKFTNSIKQDKPEMRLMFDF